ncbi:MAG: type II toxin-antitoxin system prevent-host-death family antitoxin [Candidatus Sulfotelmatobacter sp.]
MKGVCCHFPRGPASQYVISLYYGEDHGKARSAAANRKFSKLLRAVRKGQSYVVTSHGKRNQGSEIYSHCKNRKDGKVKVDIYIKATN